MRIEVIEGSPEWHALRLDYVGGSEISGLWGLQEAYGASAFTLHMVKARKIPAPPVDDSPGSRVWAGKRKEATIAAMGAELYGWTIEKGGYYANDSVPGAGASLDYIIAGPGAHEASRGFSGPGALQIKNVDQIQYFQKWVDGEPPFSILLQHQHELDCAGLSWGVILAEVGGNQFPAFWYDVNERIRDQNREKIAEFWAGVRAGKAPPVDGTDSTAEALREVYPWKQDEEVISMVSDNEMPLLVTQLLTARAAAKQNKADIQDAQNQITAKLGGARRAEGIGWTVRVQVNKDTPDRLAQPGEIIKGRRGAVILKATQDISK